MDFNIPGIDLDFLKLQTGDAARMRLLSPKVDVASHYIDFNEITRVICGEEGCLYCQNSIRKQEEVAFKVRLYKSSDYDELSSLKYDSELIAQESSEKALWVLVKQAFFTKGSQSTLAYKIVIGAKEEKLSVENFLRPVSYTHLTLPTKRIV